ncbi:MAG: heparinase II/III-family protein [Oscillospiraceae bacterium]|nr:heparinase II/III-family protein [Oscillospiraceae bacterium]
MRHYRLDELKRAFEADYAFFQNLKAPNFLRSAATRPEALEILQFAEEHLGKDIPCLRYSDYKTYHTTGSRSEFELAVFRRRDRLQATAVAAVLSGDPRFFRETEDLLWTVCNEYTWCLPAHSADCTLPVPPPPFEPEGLIKTAPVPQPVQLDLFTAETALALTEICHLLDDRLSALVKHRIRTLVKERLINPFMNLSFESFWFDDNCNWAAVCAGCVGMAAMYLIPEPQPLARIIYAVLASVECFLSGFGEDGLTTEGPSYWEYGFGYFCFFAQTLFERSGGQIDLFADEKVKKIAFFPEQILLAEGQAPNFADCRSDYRPSPGLVSLLKEKYPRLLLSAHSSEVFGETRNTVFKPTHWPHFSRSFFLRQPQINVLPDGDRFFESGGWVISRNRTEHGFFSFAAKGGHNGEMHNHNDLGSFILHYSGEDYLCELGAGVYVRESFGSLRYTFLNNSSRGHSVPLIGGAEQSPGKDTRYRSPEAALFCAEVLRAEFEENKVYCEFDLTKAYSTAVLERFTRAFTLNKQNYVLSLSDCFRLTGDVSVTERFVTRIKPEISDGQLLIRGKNGICAVNSAQGIMPEIRSEVLENNDPLARETVYFIDYTAVIKDGALDFKFYLKG